MLESPNGPGRGLWEEMMAGFWSKLTGTDTPDGAALDAWNRLRAGDIPGGRELLRRLTKHEPANLDAQLLAAFELLRPPENRPEVKRLLTLLMERGDGGSPVDALISIAAFAGMDLKNAFESYLRATRKATAGPHAAALLLLARLCSSDLIFRVGFLPQGQGEIPVDTLRLNPLNSGAAALIMRRYPDALRFFAGGSADAAQASSKYCELGKLTPAQRDIVASTVRRLSPAGEALVLRDQGQHVEARRIWERLLAESSGDVDVSLFRILASE